MATIVGGFLMPHDPLITGAPQAAPEQKRQIIESAFDTIGRRIRALNADTVISIGDDHYAMFGPHCIPRCLIAIGDVDGPLEDWLNIPRAPMANNTALAEHILKTGFADGIDWAFAKSLTVDHAAAVPHHFVSRHNPGVRTIPIYQNAGVFPVIESRRSHVIGQSIRRAVESWDKDERVVVLGTGGISHWVGSAEMGRVNEAFDRHVLGMAEQGDVEGLIALSDDYILEQGGNGALEIKNWICAMGVMGEVKASLIAYEAVPEWITGIGFAELKRAA
jgi:protocatechuate 4,5-dioxygenase beta chain